MAAPQAGRKASSSSSSFFEASVSLESPPIPPKPKLKSLKFDVFFQKLLASFGFSSSFLAPTPPKLQLVPQPPMPKPELGSSFLVVTGSSKLRLILGAPRSSSSFKLISWKLSLAGADSST
jgi:hypothetical protein